MSLHAYTGPRPTRRTGRSARVVWLFTVATIGLQVAYPLVTDTQRVPLVNVTVTVFAAASALHAAVFRGFAWAVGFAVVAIGGGFAAELAGIRTGWPFGEYVYTDVLQPQVLGVPVIVPLAWAMMLYPTYVAVTLITRSRWLAALLGGFSMMAWDVFLDPMMVQLNAWRWSTTGPSLLGVVGIPAQNFLGWFVSATVLTGLLLLLPRRDVPLAAPATLYVWVYTSSVLGAALFFDRPHVALVGGVAMGAVVVSFVLRLWTERT